MCLPVIFIMNFYNTAGSAEAEAYVNIKLTI